MNYSKNKGNTQNTCLPNFTTFAVTCGLMLFMSIVSMGWGVGEGHVHSSSSAFRDIKSVLTLATMGAFTPLNLAHGTS